MALSLAALIAVTTTPCSFGTEPTRLSNNHLQLGFRADTGTLAELIDKRTGQNTIELAAEGKLWTLEFSGGSRLVPAKAKKFEIVKQTLTSLHLRWSGFGLDKAHQLSVNVFIDLDSEQPLSRWRIGVENLEPIWLANVRFPQIDNITEQESEFLAAPVWLGQVASNPRALLNSGNQPRRLHYDYPGHTSMQLLAWYAKPTSSSEKPFGLYLSCNDTNAFRKNFEFFGDGKTGAGFEVVHLPEIGNRPPKNFAPPYDVVVGTFQGDWFTAAETYRSWATNQYWARESRLSSGAVSKWTKDTALWVWNRGRSENVIEPAIALQKQLRLPVSVFWHWWHGCAYDAGFPEYLPPREGNESFKAALNKAHKNDVHAIVYMNQRLWGMHTASWTNESAEVYAVKNREGNVQPEIYNTFTQSPCASMCMATPFWRNKYAGIATEAIQRLNVDGIYMDQACSSLACYDPKHGHSIGGGTYWMNGFRLLATDIRERNRGEKITLAGEGVGESWLPYLDLMLSLQVSRDRYAAPDNWEPIPWFQAVYHPYVIQYGNYSSLTMPPYDELWPAQFAPEEPLKLLDRKFSRQFYLEQARAFVWGQQPTIANFRPEHLEQRKEEIAYVLQLARLRERTKKFLLNGIMLRAPEINAPQRKIDISRLSIYAGQKGALSTFEKTVPMAIASAWQTASGDFAVVVASIADEKLPVEFDLSSYPIPANGKIYLVDELRREEMAQLKDAQDLKKFALQLPPRSAMVVEFTSK